MPTLKYKFVLIYLHANAIATELLVELKTPVSFGTFNTYLENKTDYIIVETTEGVLFLKGNRVTGFYLQDKV